MAKQYENQKVTLYYTSEFLGNIIKLEIKLHELGTQDYAQYKNVPYCIYTKKRSRKRAKYLVYYMPKWIIVDGWDNPEPESTEVLLKESKDVKVSTYNCSFTNPQEYKSLLSIIPEKKVLFVVGLDNT
jgi:hypothetical protein